jgi:hypothetical protein
MGVKNATERSFFKWMGTMIFDAAEVPDTRESVEAARQQAQRLVQLWDQRALYATVAFVLSCAAVYPFCRKQVTTKTGDENRSTFKEIVPAPHFFLRAQ